jgi:hypothetical protein
LLLLHFFLLFALITSTRTNKPRSSLRAISGRSDRRREAGIGAPVELLCTVHALLPLLPLLPLLLLLPLLPLLPLPPLPPLLAHANSSGQVLLGLTLPLALF